MLTCGITFVGFFFFYSLNNSQSNNKFRTISILGMHTVLSCTNPLAAKPVSAKALKRKQYFP